MATLTESDYCNKTLIYGIKRSTHRMPNNDLRCEIVLSNLLGQGVNSFWHQIDCQRSEMTN